MRKQPPFIEDDEEERLVQRPPSSYHRPRRHPHVIKINAVREYTAPKFDIMAR
jgi:hypothetical protein